MPTRSDIWCRACGHIQEITKRLDEDIPKISCPSCGEVMSAYFASAVPINYGFRPDRYKTNTDRDIAQFQFTHL